jgi:hypothetical protein
MKIKTVPTTRLALFCTALVAAWFMLSDRASAVSIREARELGLVQFGASSRHSDGSTYINNLIGMALRSNEMANRQYLRSDNLKLHAVLIDHMNRRHALGSREGLWSQCQAESPSQARGRGSLMVASLQCYSVQPSVRSVSPSVT